MSEINVTRHSEGLYKRPNKQTHACHGFEENSHTTMQNNKSTKPPNPHTLLILQTPETRSHVDNNPVGKNFKLMSELYQPKQN